jgi:hypothetical protein
VAPQPRTDDAEPADPITEAEETLQRIKKKLHGLFFWEDRRRTRRFHRLFLVTILLVFGKCLWGLVSSPKRWSEILFPAIFMAPLAGVAVAIVGSMFMDLTNDLVAYFWYRITGRKQAGSNLPAIAERFEDELEDEVVRRSLPPSADPSVTPADAEPKEAPDDAITPSPPARAVTDAATRPAPGADDRPTPPGG